MYSYTDGGTPILSSSFRVETFDAFRNYDPSPVFLHMPKYSVPEPSIFMDYEHEATTEFQPEETAPQIIEYIPDIIIPPTPTSTPVSDYNSSDNDESSKAEDIAPAYVLRPKSSRTEMSLTHPIGLQAIENVFAHIMPSEIPNRLVRGGRAYPHYLIHRHIPVKGANPRIITLTHQSIASTEWAEDYPGCKLLVKLKPGTFPSAEQYDEFPHLVLLSRGDKIIFDEYDPGFQYELTRILHLEKDKYHVEMVAFNKNGDFFSEASQAFFPCVIELPTHLINCPTFYHEDNVTRPRLRRIRRRYPSHPSRSLSVQSKAPLDPDTLRTFTSPLPVYPR